jgi:GAF domain-containing protein
VSKHLKLNIGTKLGIGFGILTLALIINAFLINRVLNKSEQINTNIMHIYQPSEALLGQMQDMIGNSRMLIKNWVFVDKMSNTPDKIKLQQLHNTDFLQLQTELYRVSAQWDKDERLKLESLCKSITDTLFAMHRQVMLRLDRMSNYDDPGIMFAIIPLVSDNGDIILQTDKILSTISGLQKHQQSKVVEARIEMDKSFSELRKFIIITCIALVVVSLLLAFITVRSLVGSINYIKNILLSMGRGVLPTEKIHENTDEIGEMSKALNELVTGLHALSGFALEIGRGNYDSEFKPLSDQDVLGNSLLRMRDDLKLAAEEEAKRKLEDQHRNWASAGIAKFSDILRHDTDKLDTFSYNVISHLVDYMEANQGGVFVINTNDNNLQYIELVACYAYNRRKYLEKHIQMGEGLVGRCIIEKEPIYLTDIPENYIKINSGLGEANPRSLLLVPLIMNDEVLGVIEVASFVDIQQYQIDFVVKIAEIVAATLSTVKINMRTSKLLEQSKIQAEELVAQEEEMRQNMEELRATQEQSQRKEQELLHALDEIKHKKGQNENRN